MDLESSTGRMVVFRFVQGRFRVKSTGWFRGMTQLKVFQCYCTSDSYSTFNLLSLEYVM